MNIRTENDIREFNAALDKCTHSVWLMGPNDEVYNMKNEKAMTTSSESSPILMKTRSLC